jgi:hypothetical protein
LDEVKSCSECGSTLAADGECPDCDAPEEDPDWLDDYGFRKDEAPLSDMVCWPWCPRPAMTPETVRAMIPLPDTDLVPPPELFLHQSYVHGQAHVARVLVHGLRLVAATGTVQEAPRLWAAIYLHDIAREHDGRCKHHGADSWRRFGRLPETQELFERGGVVRTDYAAIEAAVTIHCSGEPTAGDPHFTLMALLKDADGLDRVRLGDLRPELLRHDEARTMVAFAQRLHDETNYAIKPGPDYFARLWPEALRIMRIMRSLPA